MKTILSSERITALHHPALGITGPVTAAPCADCGERSETVFYINGSTLCLCVEDLEQRVADDPSFGANVIIALVEAYVAVPPGRRDP